MGFLSEMFNAVVKTALTPIAIDDLGEGDLL